MNIVLIGHGYVGNYIKNELDAVVKQFRWVKYKHITHKEPLFDLFNQLDEPIDFIINAAGYTGVPNVDACELLENRQKCIEGNVTFPLSLSNAFRNVPVLHISSGCVYNGYPPEGYLEKDTPNFDFGNGSFYSGSKALFQTLWQNQGHFTKDFLFRIRMPFGPDTLSKNLLVKLSKYPRLYDKLNSVSYMPDVAKAAVYFALNHKDIPKGIYNAVNVDPVKISQLAEMFMWDKEYMSDAEFKQVANAPRSNCTLNPTKMERIFNFTPTQQALEEVKELWSTLATL